jgi:Ca-activated chloride channel family protein
MKGRKAMQPKRTVPAGRAGEVARRSERSNWHPQPGDAGTDRLAAIFRRRAKWRWTMLACLVFSVLSNPSGAETTGEVTPAQMQAGSLLFRMANGYRVATRLNTSIDARISGLVARVSVRQEFRNDGQEWVEGVYVFPLPDTAAVDHLRMYAGDRFIEGEIREKARAKKEYEAAKAQGKKASLVEQQRANLFTTSVANVAPGEAVTIEIEYLETLRYVEGTFSLRVPTTFTPRYIPGAPLDRVEGKGSGWAADTTAVPDASAITPPVVAGATDHKLTFTADLNPGIPLAFIASRYHVVDISNLGGRYHIGLADGIVPMDHDLELTWKPEKDSEPRAMMFTESIDGAPHVLLMMLPPDDMSAPLQSMPRELVFVIDTSGSMHGTSLEQARRALALALDGLEPRDRFNIIEFNSVTNALFPSAVQAGAHNLDIARRFVAGLSADGGTEMAPAIRLALAGNASETHLRQVIFITDGSVGNEEQLYGLIEQRLGNTRLFTVGIGSAPNSWFMRKAAEAGRGSFTMISALHEVNEKMQRLFRKLERPQVTDIDIRWPSGIAAESYPVAIPDLYSGEPVLLKARLTGAARAGDLVTVQGVSALGGWSAELPIAVSEERSGIAALWARARIEHLMDRGRRGAAGDEIRAAVVETALEHHLVSRYTSLVAVDKTPIRPDTAGLSSEQVASLLPRGQSATAIFGFPATATDARWSRLAGTLLLMLAALAALVTGRRHRDAIPVCS